MKKTESFGGKDHLQQEDNDDRDVKGNGILNFACLYSKEKRKR